MLAFIESCGVFPDRSESSKIARWHDEVVCMLAGMEAVRLFYARFTVSLWDASRTLNHTKEGDVGTPDDETIGSMRHLTVVDADAHA
jgi:hypothetical protein